MTKPDEIRDSIRSKEDPGSKFYNFLTKNVEAASKRQQNLNRHVIGEFLDAYTQLGDYAEEIYGTEAGDFIYEVRERFLVIMLHMFGYHPDWDPEYPDGKDSMLCPVDMDDIYHMLHTHAEYGDGMDQGKEE